MNDITLCTATNCEYANKCYRHTQGDTDNPYQSWTNFEYECNCSSGFEDFIPLHTN